jgi:hypothetical protein
MRLEPGMPKRYTLLRKTDNGQIIPIVQFKQLNEALQLVEQLNQCWPAEYFIRGPEGGLMAARNVE